MDRMTHPAEFRGKLPHLIQRLNPNPHASESAKGVDRFFRMDYMGSSEFEWGALPSALREFRAATDVVGPVEVKAVRDGVEVTGWYVGPKAHLEVASYWFKITLSAEDGEYQFNLKEHTNLHGSYGPEFRPIAKGDRGKPKRNWSYDTIGWWCVDNRGTWAMFRERNSADNWLVGVSTPKTE